MEPSWISNAFASNGEQFDGSSSSYERLISSAYDYEQFTNANPYTEYTSSDWTSYGGGGSSQYPTHILVGNEYNRSLLLAEYENLVDTETLNWLNDPANIYYASDCYYYNLNSPLPIQQKRSVLVAHMQKLCDPQYRAFIDQRRAVHSYYNSVGWWENELWLDSPVTYAEITNNGYLQALGLSNINQVVLPALLDTAGLSAYPKFKEIVTKLPEF